MQRSYSATTGGFYLEGIDKTIPTDAVAVTEAEFADLMAAQAEGLEIRPDANGKPVAAAHVATTDELLAALRKKRDRLLAASDFTQLSDSPLTDAERTAWAAYRETLRNLPATFAADPASVQWPTQPTTEK